MFFYLSLASKSSLATRVSTQRAEMHVPQEQPERAWNHYKQRVAKSYKYDTVKKFISCVANLATNIFIVGAFASPEGYCPYTPTHLISP